MATSFVLLASALAGLSQAHVAAFAKGMFCENGTDPANPNFNSNTAVAPLYNLTQEDWFFQHSRGCDAAPPPPGVFLELPAGGSFNVQLANNQAFSNLSHGGASSGEWPDGAQHPEDWNGGGIGEGCIQDSGWIHTQNESMAQGTAFAISYESDISAVTMENLVVFSVLEHSPWKSEVSYEVPAALPACPDDGCICSWMWVPRGCGQPNMYMQGFKCMVTGATSTTPVAKAQAPVMCDTDPSQCVQGAKQMIAWNQLTGNNVVTTGSQTPAYNLRNGFAPGPQNDIFEGAPSAPPTSSSSSASISRSTTLSALSQVQSLPWSSSVAAVTTSSQSALTTSPVYSPSMTTLSTVIRPASGTSSISSTTVASSFIGTTWSTSPITPVQPTTTVSGDSPATVTVTVTATPTHSGHHYTDCWVSGDEVDD